MTLKTLIFSIYLYFYFSDSKECLQYTTLSPQYCSFCGFHHYFSELYTSNTQNFNLTSCLPKRNSSFQKAIYISNKPTFNILNHKGDLEDPYDDLMTALLNESLQASEYLSGNLTFYLIGDNHFLISNPKFPENTEIFRRSLLEISIKPLFCDEFSLEGCFYSHNEKVSIIVKTDAFSFFISKSLSLQNSRLIFTDLSLSNQSIDSKCLGEKKIRCCFTEDLSTTNHDCSLISQKIIINNIKSVVSLFNFDMVMDNSELLIPQISIENCDFIDFYSIKNSHRFTSLLSFTDHLAGNFTMINSIIDGFFFEEGLFSQQKKISSLFSYNDVGAVEEFDLYSFYEISSIILLKNLIIRKFNHYNASIYTNEGESLIYLIYLENFQGNLLFFNNSFVQNHNFYSLMSIIASSSSFQINESSFISNEGDYLFEFTKNPQNNNISSCNFSNNSILSLAILQYNTLVFSNNLMINSKIPKNNFIEFKSSNLFIIGCSFLNLWTSFNSQYYMFVSNTQIEETIDFQMQFPEAPSPPYAQDIIYFSNSVFMNTNLNLILNLYSIIYMEIGDCLFKNINSFNGVSYISVQTEQYLKISSTFVENFQSNSKFLYLSYTRNISFHKFWAANSSSFFFFDIYSMTNIDDLPNATKCWLEIKDSHFFNISLQSLNGQATNFFFVNYYTLYHGFFMLIINNSYFDTIYNKNFNDDTLFYFAAGHNIISYSRFVDIANMTLFKIFVRISASNITILDSQFIINKFRFARFYYVSISYTIDILKIINTIFKGNLPILYPYSMEFLQVQSLFFSNVTIKDINSLTGASLRIYILKLTNMIIENSLFYNNSGVGENGADLILQMSYYEGFDWLVFQMNPKKKFGILNCTFQNTRNSGSITLLDQGEMFLWNSSFLNIEGQNGAILNAGTQSNVLIWKIKVNTSSSTGLGGCFAMVQSIFIIRDSWIFNTSAKESGGVLIATKESVITILNSIFEKSWANEGGMITAEDAELYLENSSFVDSQTTFQGGFFYLRKSKIKIRKVNLINGKALTGSGIHGELIKIDFEDFLIKNCSSSTEKGLGNLFLNGVDENNNTINRMICQGNIAMSGACLYAKDIVITLTNALMISNFAYKESVIVIFQASLYTELNILNIEFKNNTARMAIIQTEFCQIDFLKCFFINNSINSYLVFIKESQLLFSNITISGVNPLEVDRNAYLIGTESSKTILIENCHLSGGNVFGLINLNLCENVKILKCIFIQGNAINGGAINSNANILMIANCNFSHNFAKLEGGAIFLIGGQSTNIINSTFSYNYALLQGADFHVDDSSHNYPISFSSCTIYNSKFFYSLYYSIYANYLDEFIIAKSEFNGFGIFESNKAFEIYDILKIEISESLFKEYGFYGIGNFENNLEEISQSYIDNCQFINGSSNKSGGLLSYYGEFNVFITNSSFVNGTALENGGAIAFYCGNFICSLNLEKNLSFINNNAKLLGGAIYSQKTEVELIENKVFFFGNSASLGNDIFTFPAKIIAIAHIDFKGLEKYINQTFFTNGSKNFSNKTTIFETKSGYNIQIAIIITDHFNNLIKYDSDSFFYIKNQGINFSDLTLENNIVKLSEGSAIFNQITLIANPGHYKLSLQSESGDLNETITFLLNPCGRGDTMNGKRCVKCSEGFFSLENDPQAIFLRGYLMECEKCPSHSKCPGSDKIIPDEGYWRIDENSTIILQCFQASACPYQADYEKIDQTKLNFKCGKGYWGNLCMNCEKGYGRGYNTCFNCEEETYYIGFFFHSFFLTFMSILESYLAVRMKGKFSSSSLIKIFFYHNAFLMTITSMSFNININNEMRELFSIINDKTTLTPSNIYNFYCFMPNSMNREEMFKANLIIQTLVPIIYTILLVIVKTFTDLAFHYFKKKKNHWKRMFEMNFLILFYISYRNWYPRVIFYTILLFKCVDLGPEFYVWEYPSIQCLGEEHKKLMIYVCLPSILVWSITVPLATYYLIKKKSREILFIEDEGRICHLYQKEGMGKDKIKNKKFGAIYFCLVSDYKEKYKYWQVVEFFILTVCLFLSQITSIFDELVRRIFLFIVYGIFFLIYLKFEPYRAKINTNMICLSFIICIFTLIFEIIGSNEHNDIKMRNFAKNFVLSINVIFFFSFAVAISKTWISDNKAIIVNIGDRFKQFSLSFAKIKRKE